MKKSVVVSLLALSLSAVPMVAQSRSTIRDTQQALKDKGLDPGPVDGINGKQTKAALKKFQGQQNLTEDGRMGPKTLAALGVKPGSVKTDFSASGENLKNGYSNGGSKIAEGTKEAGSEMKKGKVGEGTVDFGKGVGKGVAKMGVSTGHAAVNVGKGIKNAVVPAKK